MRGKNNISLKGEQMQKQILKKFLAMSIALVLMLVMACSIKVYAANEPVKVTSSTQTANITVENVEKGATVNAYRLTTVKLDANLQLQDPMYSWNGKVADLVKAINNNYSDPEILSKINADEATVFYDKLSAKIKANDSGVSAEKTQTVTATGKVTLNVPMGTYLILVENSHKVYSPSVVNVTPKVDNGELKLQDQTVVEKANEPTVKRTVVDINNVSENNGKNNANIGTDEQAKITIEADIPHYPVNSTSTKTYTITDTLEGGLTVDQTSIKVYKGNTPLTEGTEYTLEKNGTTVKVIFNYEKIKDGDKVSIIYNADLTKNTASMSKDGNNGTVTLEYTNNAYNTTATTTKQASNKVFTYGMDLTKVSKTEVNTVLPGAEFELKSGNNVVKFTKVDGVYYVDKNGTEAKLVSDSNGKILVSGLDAGTYNLKETKAPEGYNIPANAETITIVDNDIDGLIENNGQEEDDNVIAKTIKNTKGFQLPLTGGIGTTIFVSTGLILIVSGIALIVIVSKKNNSK